MAMVLASIHADGIELATLSADELHSYIDSALADLKFAMEV